MIQRRQNGELEKARLLSIGTNTSGLDSFNKIRAERSEIGPLGVTISRAARGRGALRKRSNAHRRLGAKLPCLGCVGAWFCRPYRGSLGPLMAVYEASGSVLEAYPPFGTGRAPTAEYSGFRTRDFLDMRPFLEAGSRVRVSKMC